MSPEEQRIAIAEACGKSVIAFFFRFQNSVGHQLDSPHYCSREEADKWRFLESGWSTVGSVEEVISHENTDDYLNDLNAMHEAEKFLPQDPFYQGYYLGCLKTLTNNQPYFATAKQRAEAFLRTIGKWKDE